MSADTIVDLDLWIDRVQRLLSFTPATASLDELNEMAPDLNAWCGFGESLRAGFAGRRFELAREEAEPGQPLGERGDPEGAHQRRSKQGRRASARDLERERTLSTFPAMRDGLLSGAFVGEHVDVVTALVRDLTAQQQLLLRDHEGEIVVLASTNPPEPFRVALRRLMAKLVADDGLARFERQRRNTRLKAWTDRETGMVKLYGEFDPERGAIIMNRLQAALDALHALPMPDGCPEDPVAKNDHLRALALLHLLKSGGGSLFEPADGGPDRADVDLVVVVDHDTLCSGVHDHSIIDAGHGIELPVETLRRLACCANIIPVVLGSDGVVLDQGREVRLANRRQRRALRAMYPTCAIAGCATRFDHCKIHHILWWGRDNGPTDLVNLVPLCSKHHHAAHEGGWQISINPTTRELTVRLPAGDVVVMPPPRQGWNGGSAATEVEPEPEVPPDVARRAS